SSCTKSFCNGAAFQTALYLFNGYSTFLYGHPHRWRKLENGVARHAVKYSRAQGRCNQLTVGNEHHIHHPGFINILVVARVGPKYLIKALIARKHGRVERSTIVAGTFRISRPSFCGTNEMIFHFHTQRLAEVRSDGACHDYNQVLIGNLNPESRLGGEDHRTDVKGSGRGGYPFLVDLQESMDSLNEHFLAHSWHTHPLERLVQSLTVPRRAKYADVARIVAKGL